MRKTSVTVAPSTYVRVNMLKHTFPTIKHRSAHLAYGQRQYDDDWQQGLIPFACDHCCKHAFLLDGLKKDFDASREVCTIHGFSTKHTNRDPITNYDRAFVRLFAPEPSSFLESTVRRNRVFDRLLPRWSRFIPLSQSASRCRSQMRSTPKQRNCRG